MSAVPVKTSRGAAMRWLSTHRGLFEEPPGSNTDSRVDGIRAAQIRVANGAMFLVAQAWCGTWFARALIAAGVKGVTSRLASVSFIEQDAKARRAPFGRGWITTSTPQWWKIVLRGDGAVMFASGEHVATVRSTAWVYRKLGLIVTDEGNTSPGNAGSQFDGGTSSRRLRRIADVYGFALVHYPTDSKASTPHAPAKLRATADHPAGVPTHSKGHRQEVMLDIHPKVLAAGATAVVLFVLAQFHIGVDADLKLAITSVLTVAAAWAAPRIDTLSPAIASDLQLGEDLLKQIEAAAKTEPKA